jgi:hypothetical protein
MVLEFRLRRSPMEVEIALHHIWLKCLILRFPERQVSGVWISVGTTCIASRSNLLSPPETWGT